MPTAEMNKWLANSLGIAGLAVDTSETDNGAAGDDQAQQQSGSADTAGGSSSAKDDAGGATGEGYTSGGDAAGASGGRSRGGGGGYASLRTPPNGGVGTPTAPMPPNAAGDPGPVPRPCLPDCKPIYNHVAGPKNHVLCKTHGHVYDEAALMIIANSVKEYDAQYPIPRPMQPDCKGVKGQLPYAPKNIMVCEHGHVLDIGKGQIVGNTRTMYLRAHPEYAGPPRKASPDPPSPPPKPSGGGSCNIEITKRDSIVNYLHVFVSVAADGSWDALLGWTYSGIEWLPDRVFCQITLIDNADRDGKEYSMTTDPTPVQSSDAEYHTNLKASTKIAYGGQVYVRATVYSTVKQTSVIGAESSFDVSLLSGQG